MDIKKDVSKTLEELLRQKCEIETRISLIQSFDWTKKVTEDEWHELCETSIRYSPLLANLVLNLFPNATDISIGCNYVYFKLYGYKIQIPTSRGHGINVSTEWYKDISYAKAHRTPAHRLPVLKVRKYFDAKDKHLGWKAEAEARLDYYLPMNTLGLAISWFGKYKWRKVDRERFEELWKKEENDFAEETKRLEEIDEKNRGHLLFIQDTLLPELNQFSTEHYLYNDDSSQRNLRELFEAENMKYTEE